jgi:hypothetical protein
MQKDQAKTRNGTSISNSPSLLLIVIAQTVFFAELFIMILLNHLPPMPPGLESFVDATILSIIVFPVLYIMFFRPLNAQIVRRKQIESEQKTLINKLQKALSEVKLLQGLLPICSSCKKIRDEAGVWNKIESYISEHSGVEFTHSYCNDCIRKLYPEDADEIIAEIDNTKTD